MFTAYMKTGGVFQAATMKQLKKQIADCYEEDGSCDQIKALTMHNEDLEMDFGLNTIGRVMEDIDEMIEKALDEIPDTTDYQEHNTHWGL